MIKAIAIENFQSHKETEIELSPGINLFTGESDNGKSAILRALIWAITNRPLGDEFINDDSEDNIAAVEIETAQHLIARARGKSVNLYYLDDDEMEGFGNNPPDEIEKALQMSGINIQQQKDSFFLFDKSAGEVGRYLNNIIDLTVIDTSLTHANKRVKRIDKEIEVDETQKEEFETELLSLDWVKDTDKELKRVEGIEQSTIQMAKESGELYFLLDHIKKAEEDKSQAMLMTKLETDYSEAASLKQQLTTDRMEKTSLESIIKAMSAAESELKASAGIAELEKELNELTELDDQLEDKAYQSDKLKELIESIEEQEHKISELANDLSLAEIEFHELMPDQCPLCGGNYVLHKKKKNRKTKTT